MYSKFPLFQSHLDLAHSYWKEIVVPGDIVIDATCGNGQDTLVLAKLTLTNTSGTLFAFDIQNNAIKHTSNLLNENLSTSQLERTHIIQACHSKFPETIQPNSVKLIVYNLGYLPGSNKQITTKVNTTLQSIQNACDLLMNGGIISLTCYPGHDEGHKEQDAIIDFCSKLDPKIWNSCQHTILNRKSAPSLILLQKCSS